jgi:hypothetical protein
MGPAVHIEVAIAAIHSQLARMNLMAVFHGLFGLVTDVQVLGRKPIPENEDYDVKKYESGYRGDRRDLVCPLWEYHSVALRYRS